MTAIRKSTLMPFWPPFALMSNAAIALDDAETERAETQPGPERSNHLAEGRPGQAVDGTAGGV